MTRPDHAGWLTSLVENLDHFGPDAIAAAAFIRQHSTPVTVHEQPTGARWTINRRIEIHPRFAELAPDNPLAISLIIHEVRHLQQGMRIALSVYGELEAWQLQFGFLKSVTGRYHSDAARDSVIAELMLLPLGRDRGVLQSARALMRRYAGPKYRIDLLPLYPMPSEVLYRVVHKQPAPRALAHR